eukprot:3449624-Rhodomonas_salina.3
MGGGAALRMGEGCWAVLGAVRRGAGWIGSRPPPVIVAEPRRSPLISPDPRRSPLICGEVRLSPAICGEV